MLRLDKWLAEMTEGSRAEVKKWIRQGRVYVNETKVQRPETKLDPGRDQVTLDGEQIIYEQFCYYMLNKPAGVVSATTDREHKTVMDLLQEANTQDVFPVGRLDIDTEGLLLLTNDGALAHDLLSPRKHVDKTYFVRIAGNLSDADVKQLEQGMDIGDEKLTLPAKVSCLEQFPEEQEQTVTIKLREGRYHQVKRMFAKVGHPVLYLQRVSMGTLTLDDSLKIGEYRELTADEIAALKR